MVEDEDQGQLAILHGLLPGWCIEQVTVVEDED